MSKRRSKWEISCFGWHGIAGVYCIMSNDEKPIVHYIGSSKDIGKRILAPTHPYRVLYDKGIICYVKFKETSDYIALERALIKRINPRLNKHHVNRLNDIR